MSTTTHAPWAARGGAAQHTHRKQHESGPYPLGGMCECPGCANAFAYYIYTCRCGATRRVCSGMGTASEQQHVAHGYSRWERADD